MAIRILLGFQHGDDVLQGHLLIFYHIGISINARYLIAKQHIFERFCQDC